MTRVLLALLVTFIAASAVAVDGIALNIGPVVSNLDPADPTYGDRFLTPGTAVGLAVDVDTPGILGFRISGEYFWKNSSPSGWDGEISAVLVSAMPSVTFEPFSGFRTFACAGAVYVTGTYKGTDDFGAYVEAEGNTVGFGFSLGFEIPLLPPVSGRLEYRHSFADLKTDNAIIDGSSSTVYPAETTDMGYSQFCITFPVSIFGSEGSIF